MGLEYERTNGYENIEKSELDKINKYAEGYKNFLDNGKTEREVVKESIELLKKNGFKEYTLGDKIHSGDKLYYNNRGKALFIIKGGTTENIKGNGIRIMVAHVDSPRLDLKQVPLYEKDDLAFFKTHYYGGIKKYQWLTIPLALHGVIMKKDGTKLEIALGEKDTDPVFYITDLLPHLSQEQNTKKVTEAFQAENLNVLVGGMPVGDEKKAVKNGVLELLNKEYGIEEEDFLSAEIEVVPANKARDVGFDRAFISSYGHDDRVCAYPEITATIETETKQTVLTVLADKEEIGSVGVSGMQSILIKDIIDIIADSYGISSAVLRSKSKCLSADVTAAYDPTYNSAFEGQNASYICKGVAMNKFTGSRGKSGSNDASAEYVGFIRSILAKDNVIWQTGELGKVDLGGGGTVAMFLANYNIETVDLGVPVLSMHSPNELIAKVDIYQAHKAFSAFVK